MMVVATNCPIHVDAELEINNYLPDDEEKAGGGGGGGNMPNVPWRTVISLVVSISCLSIWKG